MILGSEYGSRKAAQIIESLTTLAKAGNTITEQNVDYRTGTCHGRSGVGYRRD